MDDKRLAIITPLVLLVILVTFTQVLIVPRWLPIHKTGPAAAQPRAGDLQIMEYNYNKDLVQISVALWNRGGAPLTITGISYDGLTLVRGTVGSPNDLIALDNTPSMPGMMLRGTSGNSSGYLTSNDIIFPASDHWNMDTAGASAPTIEPNGIATLYLGVTSTTPGSTHALEIIVGAQHYLFELER